MIFTPDHVISDRYHGPIWTTLVESDCPTVSLVPHEMAFVVDYILVSYRLEGVDAEYEFPVFDDADQFTGVSTGTAYLYVRI